MVAVGVPVAGDFTGADIVPPEILDPSRRERRLVDRDLCAPLVNGYLRRLARQEALCRRILGRLARAFLAKQGHHKLGFARLGDYTRERLGLSAREVQELSRVADGLERLPAVAAAFECGEVSWTHTRLLVSVATPETEAQWLALARGRPVRALESLVADAAGASAPEDDDAVDGEPRVRFWLRCPRRVRVLWGEVAELASRMSGAELAAWQAAEAIAAEGLSAVEAQGVMRWIRGLHPPMLPTMRGLRSTGRPSTRPSLPTFWPSCRMRSA